MAARAAQQRCCALLRSATHRAAAFATPSGRPHRRCEPARCVSSAVAPPALFTPVPCLYADWAEVPLPEGHRFPMHKYRTTRLQLEADASLAGRLRLLPSPLARLEDVLRVHCPDYVQRVMSGTLSVEEQRLVGFPYSDKHVQRSFASTGGTVAAMHLCMSGEAEAPAPGAPRRAKPHAAAMQLAGGTHHAFRDRGEGFCVFNDIAVAAVAAMHTYGADALPVLVIDLDVHQGNGTAAIFEDDPHVVTFSMHGEKNYPWKSKMRSTYDVELPDGTGDDAYLALLDAWLPRLFQTHAPRLVFYQAGVDALAGDAMGRLAMTRAGLARRNHAVYTACLAARVPCVVTMGGGYTRPADASIDAHADVFRAAALRFSMA